MTWDWVERADSIASDAHKWLNVPYDSGSSDTLTWRSGSPPGWTPPTTWNGWPACR